MSENQQTTSGASLPTPQTSAEEMADYSRRAAAHLAAQKQNAPQEEKKSGEVTAKEQARHAERIAAASRERLGLAITFGLPALIVSAYTTVSALALHFPSIGQNPVTNFLPPTAFMKFSGTENWVSIRVNWELARAAKDPTFRKQLILASYVDQKLEEKSPKSAEIVRKELGRLLDSKYISSDEGMNNLLKATPAQKEAGAVLIREILEPSQTAAPAPKTSLPSLKEGPIPPRDTSLSEDFAKKVRDGKITLNGSELDQRLEAMRTIDEDEVKEIRRQWKLATTSTDDVKTAFTAANAAKPAELLTFAAKTKGILSATPEQRSWLDPEDRNKKETRDAAAVENTMKMMIR
jgi:hypothetical protein